MVTGDEGKVFTDAAYILAFGGLVVVGVQTKHGLRTKLEELENLL